MRLQNVLLCAAIAFAAPMPAVAQANGAIAESVKPQSIVSLAVEPKLSDERLVLKIAAKNRGTAAVPFGPASITIAKPNGQAIALYPLQSLINDVRLAAGMEPAAGTPTAGAYASPQMQAREGGQLDVTGYTGGQAIGSDQYRRARGSTAKPALSEAEAKAQIAALNQAILQPTSLAPGQVAAGQVVSDKLKFAKDEERILYVRVRVAGDEHSFTIAAPTT
jgi:hypothetical protein